MNPLLLTIGLDSEQSNSLMFNQRTSFNSDTNKAIKKTVNLVVINTKITYLLY